MNKSIITKQMERIAEKVVERWVRNPPGLNPWGRIGTVVAVEGNLPKVYFAHETEVDARTYPRLASYTPTVGDRVLLRPSGGTWIVEGKVVSS